LTEQRNSRGIPVTHLRGECSDEDTNLEPSFRIRRRTNLIPLQTMTESKRVIRADLAKLDAHEIPPEEYEEVPEAIDEWFDKAELAVGGKVVRPARRPGRLKSDAAKKLIALRLDPDVIERFRANSPGCQSRINGVLREYLEQA
jgi:uncharacterized protein (DUF4415 family)